MIEQKNTDTQADEASAPVVKMTLAEQYGSRINQLRSGWNASFASPVGGTERRRQRRRAERDATNELKKVNRRRFRQFESTRMAATTLKQQVRIFDGQIGNDRQRARVTAEFNQRSRDLGQPVDEVVDALRTGLGLA